MKYKLEHILLITVAILTIAMLVSTDYVHAAAQAADIDQCRNGPFGTPNDCKDLGGSEGWVNGNAGASDSHFEEGQSIPYRATVTGLTSGDTVTLQIEYDIKHSGKFAIDYLTFMKQGISAVVDPCDGAGVTPANCPDGAGANFFDFSTALGPSGSPAMTCTLPGTGVPAVQQPCASYNSLPSNLKRFVIVGGTISSVSYTGSAPDLTASTASVDVLITFSASASTVVLAWGGHIASRLDWGLAPDNSPFSAGGISGSPYHMRLITMTVNGGEVNLGNQDRSLSAAAVVAAPQISTTIVDSLGDPIPGTPPTITVGAAVHDTATITGGFSPGGTVTYKFFTNGDCSGVPASTEDVTASAGTVPDSSSQTISPAGSYSYQAHYGGDTNNNAADSACEPLTVEKAQPGISTTIKDSQGDPVTSISTGTSIHDTATLSGGFSPITGTVTYSFFTNDACTGEPTSTEDVTVSAGVVPDSSAQTINSPGSYSYMAHYGGDDNNLAADSACEPLTVIQANLEITKTADAATVNAGETIGFTITVTNAGAGTATGVSMTDTLPTGTDIVWSIAGTTGSPDCNISSNTLTCTIASLGPGASFSVHVTSPTTQNSCAVYTNTASVNSGNDGSAETSPATITVQCSTIVIVKNTVGGDDVFSFTGTGSGGFPASFDITSSGGTGQQSFTVEPGSYSVSEVPPGNSWTLVSAVCDSGTPDAFTAPAGGTVTCTFTNQKPIPEYPFGLAAVFSAVAAAYALIRRRVVKW